MVSGFKTVELSFQCLLTGCKIAIGVNIYSYKRCFKNGNCHFSRVQTGMRVWLRLRELRIDWWASESFGLWKDLKMNKWK